MNLAERNLSQAMTTIAALIIAAGRGTRFGSVLPKQYAMLAGKPVIRHAVDAFKANSQIDCVLAVIHPDDHLEYATATVGAEILPPVHGGATRQESVKRGLEALAELKPDFVLVHDGARPIVSNEIIERVIGALLNSADGVLPVLPIAETLKRIDETGHVTNTIDRTNVTRAQTPQGFNFQKLFDAHQKYQGQSLTDDAAVLEQAGLRIATVTGDPENIKITEQHDLYATAQYLMETRIGSGFDVHRFGEGDGVTLGGVLIPMDKSLLGHSDADVVLHAATDAILGALSDGDIGVHFPPTNIAYKDASSDRFLAFAIDRLEQRGGSLVHLDITVICEIPKLSPHRDKLQKSIAAIARVPVTRVSIKATTTEGLGFTGRKEGIACQATATLKVPAT